MTVEFKLPDLGEGIHEAEILAIKVKEGETIKEDQIIFEVETDKAVVEIPSPYAGVVAKIHVKVGEVGRVGNVMITFDQAGGAAPAKKVQAVETAGAGSSAQAALQATTSKVASTSAGRASEAAAHAGGGNGRTIAAAATRTSPATSPVPAAPATRRLAREMGVDIRVIQGSGPAGRITKEDIRAFAEGVVPGATTTGASARAGQGASTGAGTKGGAAAAEAAPQQSLAQRYGSEKSEVGSGGPLTLAPFELPDFSKYGNIERVPLRSLRRKIAINMTQAWSHVPHVSNFDEADITETELSRQKLEEQVAKSGGKLTLTVIALKAVAAALKKYPQFNCSLDEAKSEIVFKHYCHIGVAVATERGLIVPVIRDVDQKNLTELSIELADVARKTRDGKIEIDRLQGGTFSITNIGPIGGTGMVPMVNFPEVAIMGMARSADKPVVRNGQIVVRNILPLALSFDHRVADGAEAAMFLRFIASCLEDPLQMLLEG
jgi:pyruvate dehydrogenase E2 component (dihydrolipoamide acetyltransferase)